MTSQGKATSWVRTLVLAAALSAGPFTAVGSDSWQQGADRIYARLNEFSAFDRKLLISLMEADVSKNDANLSVSTPKDLLWALKVISIESLVMEGVAKHGGWPEFSAWCAEGKKRYVALIRGELPPSIAERQYREWRQELRTLKEQAGITISTLQHYQPKVDVLTFNKMRQDLLNFVAGTGRAVALKV